MFQGGEEWPEGIGRGPGYYKARPVRYSIADARSTSAIGATKTSSGMRRAAAPIRPVAVINRSN